MNALEVEEVQRASRPEAAERERASARSLESRNGDDDDDVRVISGEDALRADLAASGAELFDDEDDDDQPILGGPSQTAGGTATAAGGAGAQQGRPQDGQDPQGEGGRRRRRRRRRGRGGSQGDFAPERTSSPRLEGGPIQPTAIINVDSDSQHDVTRDPLAPAPRPMIRDRHQIMAGGSPTGIDVPLGEGEELLGRELADAAGLVLNSFDRNAGPVPLRNLVDALMRRGRLAGDPAAATIQLSASLRADNLRRQAASQRPRFRFGNGARIALTDWALGGDLPRLEQEVIAAVERYRDAARRMMLRRVQELPGHAFIELALIAIERAGMTNVKAVRRAGSPGGEAHFSAVHKTGSDEIRTALVIRKDGREIGRERVTDLRGALHHYGPATAGWLVTTGQVLSGAREEAATLGAAPIAMFDGIALCKLLEDLEVGVIRTRFPVAIPDLELFETLRG